VTRPTSVPTAAAAQGAPQPAPLPVLGRQRAIRAVYMRGGTSKGVFLRDQDLPPPGPLRDRVLLRVLGSPDPYGKQIDGMGGASSSTSKVIVVAPSSRPDCDVQYVFGQVSVDAPLVDWSGNCGNLTAAVGPFAIASGLVPPPPPGAGHAAVRMWQATLGKRIDARVPLLPDGQVAEDGDFELDGVTFPAAEIRVEFLDPAGGDGQPLLPTGRLVDVLDVPGVGRIEATLITAGNPTVIVEAKTLGLSGGELQPDVNGDARLLARCEAVRAHGAAAMGLAASAEDATRNRPATPKLALVAPPCAYRASSGKPVASKDMDLSTRILSMGVLHHALTGTGSIALAVAASLPGTLAHRVRAPAAAGDALLRLGHPSGTLAVGAELHQDGGGAWVIDKAVVSRSARRLMAGEVYVPERAFA